MKKGFVIFILLLAFHTHLNGQRVYEAYTKANDSLRIGNGKTDFLPYNNKGYTLVLPDSTKTVSGVIVSLEDDKFDLINTPKQHIHPYASAKGFAVLYVSTGIPADFYFRNAPSLT